MKNYSDLYAESPRAFLRKLEEDIKGLEARLARLDRLATGGLGDLLAEYERLSLLVEQKAYGIPLVPSWNWAPLEGPRVANMYSSEELEDGRSYCWTGPADVTDFVAPVLRNEPLQLRIAFMKTIEPEMLDALAITVDGSVIKHRVAGLDIVATIAPRTSPVALPTRVSLSTGSTASPGGGDARLLGIAIYGITLSAAQTESSDE